MQVARESLSSKSAREKKEKALERVRARLSLGELDERLPATLERHNTAATKKGTTPQLEDTIGRILGHVRPMLNALEDGPLDEESAERWAVSWI